MQLSLVFEEKKIPENISEYFFEKISALDPAVQRVLLIDTDKLLKEFLQEDSFTDRSGKKWDIFIYNGENDLIFRQKWLKSENVNRLVWITFPRFSRKKQVDLTYITDIVESTEQEIDFSIEEILSDIIRDLPSIKFKQETWGRLFSGQKDIIIKNLKKFTDAFQEFRKAIPRKPLNKNHALIIMMKLKYPELNMERLVLDNCHSEMERLRRTLEVRARLGESIEDREIREWVKGYLSDTELLKIVDMPLWDILKVVYTYSLFKRMEIAAIKTHLVSRFGEEARLIIDSGFADYLNSRISKEMHHLIQGQFSDDELQWIIGLILEHYGEEKMFEALRVSGDIYSIISLLLFTHFLKNLKEPLADTDLEGIESLPDGESPDYTSILEFLKTVRWIQKKVESPVPAFDDYNKILQWYHKNEIYKIELLLDMARTKLESAISNDIYRDIRDKINEFRSMVRQCIDLYNNNLAGKIEKDYQGFITSQSLSIRAFKKESKGGLFDIESRSPSRKGHIWILLFDGMRLDTWELIIKPKLQEFFQVEKENLYFSVLPSFTDFARRSLFAGELPSNWHLNFDGQRSKDEGVFIAKNLGLRTVSEYKNLVRFITSVETDEGQEELKFTNAQKKRFNVLIFNLSDNWIHEKDAQKQSITRINERISGMFENYVLPILRDEVLDEDKVFISSDHGFIEMEDIDQKLISVPQHILDQHSKGHPVNYRYLDNLSGYENEGLTVNVWRGLNFTLAKGFQWFQRQKGRPVKYSHGGVSFDEMVVPGARLTKITVPVFSFSLEGLPEKLQVDEDKETNISFVLKNTGNQNGKVGITIKRNHKKVFARDYDLNTGKELEISDFKFTPGINDKTLELIAVDKDKTEELQRRIIALDVNPTKAFEMSMGDELDELEDLL